MAETTFLQSSRVFFLAFVAYWGIVLFGYDTGVAGSIIAQIHFQKVFGILEDKKKAADVTSNVVSVLQAGAFFGALGSAPISSKIGRKNTLLSFSVIFLVGAILTTVAGGGSKGLGEIYAGRVISGLGIGGISAVAPAFVSECSPKSLRGTITGLFQVGVAIGVMLSYFINYGISLNPTLANGPTVWRIPFGFQLVPAGIMFIGLFIVKESPRWLASVGRTDEALHNLAYYRKLSPTDPELLHEFAEIEAAIQEEKQARESVGGFKAAFLKKGNRIRFLIAFVIFLLQQWSGQNSVGYYAPKIFASIGYTGPKNSLLASGIYGVVKVVATALFIFTAVDTIGRKLSLIISAAGMGTMFFIVGALLKTHPPPATSSSDQVTAISPPSQAMAAMLYIYVVFYSLGWGPLPWVYVSDIFPTATRHYGLALASATQWLFNFNLSKVTPTLVDELGYKIFFMFGAINIGGMLTFSCIIPETKGRSLEDMDIIFGAVSAEKRQQDIEQQEQEIAHTGAHSGVEGHLSGATHSHVGGEDRESGSVREDEKV